jgi:hypothetical protein
MNVMLNDATSIDHRWQRITTAPSASVAAAIGQPAAVRAVASACAANPVAVVGPAIVWYAPMAASAVTGGGPSERRRCSTAKPL